VTLDEIRLGRDGNNLIFNTPAGEQVTVLKVTMISGWSWPRSRAGIRWTRRALSRGSSLMIATISMALTPMMC